MKYIRPSQQRVHSDTRLEPLRSAPVTNGQFHILQLFLDGNDQINEVQDICGNAPPSPRLYHPKDTMYAQFKSYRNVNVHNGFRLRFTFHNYSALPEQLSDRKWNCSVPHWADFKQHIPCNLVPDCVSGEDEEDCPYSSDACGQGHFSVGGTCYSDHSDEDFCVFPECKTSDNFDCGNHQCLNGVDEMQCPDPPMTYENTQTPPPPAIVNFDHLCDGVVQCPQRDDELLCQASCPENCTCYGEVSAFIICLITLDRFLVLRFPFSQIHFRKVSANVASMVVWAIGLALAAVPLLPMTSHWQFYGQTGICIPLPITRATYSGHGYSFGVMIVLNFVLFVLIAAGQASIYWSIRTNTTRQSKDLAIARRLITIAMSDFLCWFPIGLLGLLASNGFPIESEVNVAMAIFVLPLNSALNPFLYTLNLIMEKRRLVKEEKMRKRIEIRLQTVLMSKSVSKTSVTVTE
nr:hypothetical protein BaRGS_000580 [Batillaria attramentaria]